MNECVIHGGEVLAHNGFTALAVGFLDCFLDAGNGILARQHVADCEEAGLHHGVDARAHVVVAGDFVGINHIETQLLADDRLLHIPRQMVPDLIGGVGGVEQQCCALSRHVQHLVAFEETKLMYADEVGALNLIGAANGTGAEAQVRNGAPARFVGVVYKVALRVIVGLFADNLDRILVCAHGAVGAEAPEHGPHTVFLLGAEGGVVIQARMRDIIMDANGEVVAQIGARQHVEHALDHGGREFLGAETVASAHDTGQRGKGQRAAAVAFGHGGDNVLIERLARGARLLCAVQHADDLGGGGKRLEKVIHREGAEEAHLDEAHLLALPCQVLNRVFSRTTARAHHDENALGIRCTLVVKEVVLAAREFGQRVHLALHNFGNGDVVGVDCLATLEVSVRVLRRAAHDRGIGREAACAVLEHEILVIHRSEVFVAQLLDLVDLVRGAEAVKDVQERDACLERGRVGDRRHVHYFLDGAGKELRPTGAARRHDVAMVAKDGETLGCNRARRNVKDGGSQFARNLVHVGDHQQQALAGGEGRRQRTGRQCAVASACGAGLRLHLDHSGDGAPQVGVLA